MSELLSDERRLAAARRHLEIGHYERVLEALSGLNPETAADAYTMRLRGFAHAGLDDFDSAAEAARAGLVDEPDDIGLLYLLSIAEIRRHDLPAAEQAILAALAVEPEDPELLAQYAKVLMQAGQLDKAERLLGHAAAANPDSSQVLETRIMLAVLRHDDRRAKALSEELLARDPDSVSGQQMLGALDWNRGDARSASRRFAEVVRADPTDHDAADSARTTRRLSNPLWWPTRVFARFGAGPSWIVAVATIFGLQALGLNTLSMIAAVIWVAMCVSSWIGAAVFREK